MEIKLIATDLDGTLMSPDHTTVSEYTKKTLFEAHQRGVKIAIATGRTLSISENVIKQIPFCDYVIFSNGASVYDRAEDKIIYKNLISWSKAEKILDFANQFSVFYEVYQDGKTNTQADKVDLFHSDEFPKEFLEELVSKMNVWDDIKDGLNRMDVEKINLFYVPEENKKEVWDFLRSIPNVALTSAIGEDIEITEKTANKGNALDGMCKVLNITSDNIMAFGDAGNDLEMLKFAKYSFAMGNGTDECKNSAKFIADSNANDGLAKEVAKYILEK